MQAFEQLDADGNGFITKDEFDAALGTLVVAMSGKY